MRKANRKIIHRRKTRQSKARRKTGGCGEKLTRLLIDAEKNSPTILRTDLTERSELGADIS